MIGPGVEEGFCLRGLSSRTCREDLDDPQRMLSASTPMPPGDDYRAAAVLGFLVLISFFLFFYI